MTDARTAGLALGYGRGVAAWWSSAGAPSDARTIPLEFDAAALAAGDHVSLAAALRELRRAAGAGILDLDVALASPWTSPRLLSLPPMRTHEARAMLTRDAARHFQAVRDEPVVTVRSLSRGRGAPGRWLAADADARVLDAVCRAARDAGFTVRRIMTAAGAWGAAAGSASGRLFVVDGEASVIDAHRGRLMRLRRCRLEDAGTLPPTVSDGLELAARHATSATDAEFVSPAMREVRHDLGSRAMRWLMTVGVGAFVLAGFLRWWGAAREVQWLADARGTLRPAVTGALATRDSLLAIDEALRELRRAESGAPQWNARLWSLASVLPRDAYFTSVRGAGDSVLVEGRAASAAPLFDALRAARGVVSVRAAAPIVVNAAAGSAHEQFSVVVRFGADPRGAR